MHGAQASRTAARGCPALVSVIVPMCNQAQLLRVQLRALAAQSYRGAWELIVVENGLAGGAEAALRGWERDDVSARLVRSPRGLNCARNVGAGVARGDLLAFCDADDAASPTWLEELAKAAVHVDIVGGAFDYEKLNTAHIRRWRNDEPPDQLVVHHRFLPVVPGGNCAVWADVARRLPWDETFRFGSSDIEFSWRAQMSGCTVAFAPSAIMHIRHRNTLGSLACQWFRYGVSGAQLYRRFRSYGMPRTPTSEWLAEWRWLLAHLPPRLESLAERARWIRIAAFRIGRLAGSLRRGVVFL